jgi:hypothetical protein
VIEMVEKEDVEQSIREMPIPGYIRFSIKSNDTVENQNIHTAFKEYCKTECDNNYTLGLKFLLENYESDFKYTSLYDHIVNLTKRVNELESQCKKAEKTEQGAF